MSQTRVITPNAPSLPTNKSADARKSQPAAAEGVAPLVPEEVLRELAATRLQEAQRTGASVLIVADPYSHKALTAEQARTTTPVEVKHIITWVAEHLA